MNRQVGPSILLSVLIVTFFSIVLHQPESPPLDREARAAAVRDDRSSTAAENRISARFGAAPTASPTVRTTSASTPIPAVVAADEEEGTEGSSAAVVRFRRIPSFSTDFRRRSDDETNPPPSTAARRRRSEAPPGRWRRIR